MPARESGHDCDLAPLFRRLRGGRPVTRFDDDLADDAALHHASGTVLVGPGADGDEEQFRFAAILELKLVERGGLDLNVPRLDLADPTSYLSPGGAFGGPCLPKDVRALASRLKEVGIAAPVIDHICRSNALHAAFLLAEIERRVPSPSRILLVGLSFKGGTNDLRDSPLVDLAQTLLDRGHRLAIYDPDLAFGADGLRPALPSAVSAALVPQLPADGAWELVVVAKSAPEALQAITANCPRFHIDRL